MEVVEESEGAFFFFFSFFRDGTKRSTKARKTYYVCSTKNKERTTEDNMLEKYIVNRRRAKVWSAAGPVSRPRRQCCAAWPLPL